MILAKPVIANRYWILKQEDRKVGSIEAHPDGYQVRVNDSVARFKTRPMLRKTVGIDFHPVFKKTKPPQNQVYGYDVGCRAYNQIWDVRRRIPLFTKTPRSKSWYAAGWYKVKQHRRWCVMHNPKLIILDRYQFQGPFHTQEKANA